MKEPSMQSQLRLKLALEIFEIGAIKFGQFKLKLHEKNPNAPLSPIYIDLRILRSFPNVMNTVIETYSEITKNLIFDIYADVPTAATPIVTLLSYRSGIPMISPRMDEKTHGLTRRIDGVFAKGNIALLVDDLITKAESKLDAISVLEENGLRVNDVVVLVDREQGGGEELAQRNYNCHSAFKLSELLKILMDNNRISNDEYYKVSKYLGMN